MVYHVLLVYRGPIQVKEPLHESENHVKKWIPQKLQTPDFSMLGCQKVYEQWMAKKTCQREVAIGFIPV